jgi:hypothetical protein
VVWRPKVGSQPSSTAKTCLRSEEEDGDADADEGAGDGGEVEPAAAAAGGEVAEGDADDDREQHGGQAEFDGGGVALGELLPHGPAGLRGGAEVELDQLLHVGDVLLPQRVVEAE